MNFLLVVRNVGEMIGKIRIISVVGQHVFGRFAMHAFAEFCRRDVLRHRSSSRTVFFTFGQRKFLRVKLRIDEEMKEIAVRILLERLRRGQAKHRNPQFQYVEHFLFVFTLREKMPHL